MHITDLEHKQTLLPQSSITGGELPVEFFRQRINALKQGISLSSQDITSRRRNFDGGSLASSRSSGGNFSRTRILVPTGSDVTAVVIQAVAPSSNS